jgi:hypothetical protein
VVGERRAQRERALEHAPGGDVLCREIPVALGSSENKTAMPARRCPAWSGAFRASP